MYVVLGDVARYTLYPTTPDDVLASQLNATVYVAETPVPLSAIVVGEFVALLVIVTLPVICAALVGAKVTSSVAVCPGAMVAPLRPLPTVMPVPVAVIPEIVTLELPVFVRLTASISLLPTASFPKLRLVGDAEIVRVSAIAVPLMLNVNTVAPELLLSVTIPVSVPVVVGANFSVKSLVPPAGSVNGVVSPLVVKPVPLSVALEMVTLPVPPFFNCTDWVLLAPTGTLPNATLLGVAVNACVLAATPVPLSS